MEENRTKEWGTLSGRENSGMKQQATITTWHTLQIMHTPPPPALRALPRKTFVPLIVACGFPYRGGVEAPVAIVHHRDSHRNLAWRPIPQPWQTGSPEGGCYKAVEVLRKSTGIMGRESAALPKRPRIAPRAVPPPKAWPSTGTSMGQGLCNHITPFHFGDPDIARLSRYCTLP